MGSSQLGDHSIAVFAQTVLCFILPLFDLTLKLVHVLPHLIDHLLLKLAVFYLILGRLSRILLFKGCSTGIALLDPDRDVLHLELILTFLSLALQRLLTDGFNLGFQVDYDLAVLLLPVDVILLLGNFGLLKLVLFLQSLQVYQVVFLVEKWPVLRRDLQSEVLV